MHRFFQDTIHPAMHDCSDNNGCPAEEMNFVFDGMSFNENVATHKWENFELLSNQLCQVKSETLDCTIVILCNAEDGLFTNATGVQEYFRNFTTLDIVLNVLHGHSQWTEYRMTDVLAAIDDISNDQVLDNPSHCLVADWIRISLCKEQ
jgi:hypothetical protein